MGVLGEEQENLDGENKEVREEVNFGEKRFVDALVMMYFNKSTRI